MRMVNVNVQGDAIEFGVYLTHTNAPTPFGFAGYQIFLSFNPEIVTIFVIYRLTKLLVSMVYVNKI
jgi:hypothetical protein